MPVQYNRRVLILQAHTTATACLVGEIEVFILAWILTSVLKDRTAANPSHNVPIRTDLTSVTVCLVGDNKVLVPVWILTSVLKENTAVNQTHIVEIHKAHTNVTVTVATTCLATHVMVSNNTGYGSAHQCGRCQYVSGTYCYRT